MDRRYRGGLVEMTTYQANHDVDVFGTAEDDDLIANIIRVARYDLAKTIAQHMSVKARKLPGTDTKRITVSATLVDPDKMREMASLLKRLYPSAWEATKKYFK